MIKLCLTNSNNTSSSSSSFNESLEQILNITPTIPLTIMNIIGQQQHMSIELIRLNWCLASERKQNSFKTNLKNDFIIIHQTFKQENFNPNDTSIINDDNEEDDEN
ncbi:unnamed protein product [Rotaria sordida]|uniref:Uncharacterized protein n=1 Tax=Rotaria sordida TaxID=392033 RepID=A0A816FD44_9BILA|nr:unnamed protein product [Rotaria sordida]CAF1659749.1 unnamed protein product [Rotaria sordida]